MKGELKMSRQIINLLNQLFCSRAYGALRSYSSSLGILASFTLFTGNFAQGSAGIPKVIYGNDDRLDLYEVTNPLHQRLAHATVALVTTSSLVPSQQGLFDLLGQNLMQSLNVCATERFAVQQTSAFCSGVIVGPDLVLTAGHCIEDGESCTNTRFVVGFGLTLPKQTRVDHISGMNVYNCREIVAHELSPQKGDYSLVQVDRPFRDVEIASLNRTEDAPVGTPLTLIGHPSGLPVKVAAGASVRANRAPTFFVANTDSYAGNSGSAVFNSVTGTLEGILVNGAPDYERSQSGCIQSVHCTENGCRGEHVTKIGLVKNFIP